MIAHLDRDRRGQRGEPVARRRELAPASAHGEVAGDDDGIGPVALRLVHEPAERGIVLRAEMQVADVEDQDHRACPRIEKKRTSDRALTKVAGLGASTRSPSTSMSKESASGRQSDAVAHAQILRRPLAEIARAARPSHGQ